MRIITGSARGVKLETLEGETTRPTAERTKEAVFSMLQFDIADRSVFEPFGGSGQLSLEALSRGAASAFISDFDGNACEIIKRNAKKAKLFEKTRVVCSDYKSVIRGLSGKEKFNLIFLDPPYKSDYLADALSRITEGGIAEDGCIIVCESDREIAADIDGLSLVKQSKYGKAYITVFRKECSEE